MGDVRLRLREALAAALKARDEVATSALRAVISAIANAEAVAPAPSKVRLGVGAGDVPRQELSEAEMQTILQAEVDEMLHAADEVERLGRPEQARKLRSQAAVVRGLTSP